MNGVVGRSMGHSNWCGTWDFDLHFIELQILHVIFLIDLLQFKEIGI